MAANVIYWTAVVMLWIAGVWRYGVGHYRSFPRDEKGEFRHSLYFSPNMPFALATIVIAVTFAVILGAETFVILSGLAERYDIKLILPLFFR